MVAETEGDLAGALSRLYEDESLTAEVNDDAAKALLRWGEEQIRAGRPEEEVRRGLRAVSRVIGRRAYLGVDAARAHLEAAGLAVDGAVLVALWSQVRPQGEWAARLVGALTPLLPPAIAPTAAPPSAAPAGTSAEKGGERGAAEGKAAWWPRLFFWRRRL